MDTSNAYKKELLKDPGTHYIVNELIRVFDTKDPNDALNDLDIVRKYIVLKLSEGGN